MKIRAALCCLAASGLLLSGCSDDSGTIDEPDEAATSAAAEEETEAQAYDPPKEFDFEAGVALPPEAVASKMNTTGSNVQALPVALVGTKAFIASAERLQVVDTATGEALPDVVPASGTPMPPMQTTGMVGENPFEAPLVIESGGTTLVIAPFIVQDAEYNYDLDVVAVDGATGEVVFDVPVELPALAYGGYEHAEAMGESGGVVLIKVFDVYTVAFDTATQSVAWEAELAPYLVSGDVVVAPSTETSSNYDGLLIADGTPKWANKDLAIEGMFELQAAGPNFFVALGSHISLENGQEPYNMLFETATGNVVRQEDRDFASHECRFDGQETVVCFVRAPGFWMGALDAATGEWLWETTEAEPGINVTAVWHGIAYGLADNTTPAALDVRTGQPTGTAPGVAPYVVNEYTAVADTVAGTWGDGGGVAAYPAIG